MRHSAEKLFKSHGTLCATKPCEVIFICITLALIMISYVDWHKEKPKKDTHSVSTFIKLIKYFFLLNYLSSKYLY